MTLAFLALLRELNADRGLRHDERIISAIAIVGRGLVLALIVSDCLMTAHWAPLARAALLASLLVVFLGQARTMVKLGPTGFLPNSAIDPASLGTQHWEGQPVNDLEPSRISATAVPEALSAAQRS